MPVRPTVDPTAQHISQCPGKRVHQGPPGVNVLEEESRPSPVFGAEDKDSSGAESAVGSLKYPRLQVLGSNLHVPEPGVLDDAYQECDIRRRDSM